MQEEREGEAKKPGPEGGDAPENATEEKSLQEVVFRHFNVTHLDKNGDHLLTQDADVISMVEHKLTATQFGAWKEKSETVFGN